MIEVITNVNRESLIVNETSNTGKVSYDSSLTFQDFQLFLKHESSLVSKASNNGKVAHDSRFTIDDSRLTFQDLLL